MERLISNQLPGWSRNLPFPHPARSGNERGGHSLYSAPFSRSRQAWEENSFCEETKENNVVMRVLCLLFLEFRLDQWMNRQEGECASLGKVLIENSLAPNPGLLVPIAFSSSFHWDFGFLPRFLGNHRFKWGPKGGRRIEIKSNSPDSHREAKLEAIHFSNMCCYTPLIFVITVLESSCSKVQIVSLLTLPLIEPPKNNDKELFSPMYYANHSCSRRFCLFAVLKTSLVPHYYSTVMKAIALISFIFDVTKVDYLNSECLIYIHNLYYYLGIRGMAVLRVLILTLLAT